MNYILSKFAHEIRNPLTTLYSTIQLLECQHPEVKEMKYWSNLSKDIEYMNALIDDFSNYSKAERINPSTFSLRALLEQVALSFAALTCDSHVEFTSKISPSIHQITGDKTKLQEVFTNLLKNAFEASTPDKTVYLEANISGSNVVISIQDTGHGIPAAHLSTIFEPFVTYKKNGTGLGLSISRQIVVAHGGTIQVVSREQEGTTFTVTLPL